MANRVSTARPGKLVRVDVSGCVVGDTASSVSPGQALPGQALPGQALPNAAAETDGPVVLAAEAVQALEGYLALASKVLRLDGWKVSISPVPADDDAVAQIDAPWAQRRAEVRLGAEFWVSGPEDQRDALVHELLHLVLMPAWQMVDELLDEELSARAARIGWLAFTQHMEYSIDQLASVIAPQLPLPDFDGVAPRLVPVEV